MIRLSETCTRSVAAAALVALALACGSTHREPRGCQADAECPSATYCLSGVCIAGALPQAQIRIAGSGPQLVSHRLVQFDGKGSVDPNPQHAVTGYRWAVKPASVASCAPSTARGSDAQLATIFECAGEYEVELTVKNSLGLESVPMTQGVSVAPSTYSPVIEGKTPDLVLDHRCAGSPPSCAPVTAAGDGRFALFVTASDVESSTALAYEWQVDPPPGVDPAAVEFQPDRFSRTPTVRIAGAAIAGDWTFRALVTDGDGLTTLAPVKVSIANQLPTLTSDVTQVALDHAYADNVYRAHGTLRLTAADPDGDPLLDPDVKLVESAQTGCLFAVPSTVAKGGGVSEVTIDLTCSRPDELIGAVERQLEATVRDLNGGSTTLTLPFEVRDRPPTLVATTVSTGHTVQPCPLSRGTCFTASGQVPPLSDPDGDPVSLVAITPSGLDQAIWSSDLASGGFTLQTSVSAALSFRGANGVSPVSLSIAVKDPWLSATVPVALQISNRAPIPAVLGSAPPVSYSSGAYVARSTVTQFIDEDGDPIDGLQGSGDPACGSFTLTGGAVGVTCSHPFDWTTGAFPDLFRFAGNPFSVSVSVSDPWQRSAVLTTNVTPAKPPPPVLLSADIGELVTCTCHCVAANDCSPVAPARNTNFVPAVQSAGLPVNVTVKYPDGTSKIADCLGGTCSPPVPVTLTQVGTSLTVTLYNGVSPALAPQVVSGAVSCSNDPCAAAGGGGGGGGGGICLHPPCQVPP